MKMLSIKNLSVTLNKFKLSNINLEVEKGDYYVLAGPSGSGKTILLESIAGIHEKYTTGEIYLDTTNIRTKKIQDRNVGLVFQDNTLFPHLSVKKNIEFALNRRHDKQNSNTLFESICEQLFLSKLINKAPNTLSGGEIRRVLLARTLASDPKIILLDEPLTGIDTHQKDQLISLLRNLNRKGQTFIHVTHDFDEALSLANKMGIMYEGKLIGQGKPEKILKNPGHKFVARFCGYKNYFEVIDTQAKRLKVSGNLSLAYQPDKHKQAIAVMLDEKQIEILDREISSFDTNVFTGVISDLFLTTEGTEVVIDNDISINVILPTNRRFHKNYKPGDKLTVQIPESAIRLIYK